MTLCRSRYVMYKQFLSPDFHVFFLVSEPTSGSHSFWTRATRSWSGFWIQGALQHTKLPWNRCFGPSCSASVVCILWKMLPGAQQSWRWWKLKAEGHRVCAHFHQVSCSARCHVVLLTWMRTISLKGGEWRRWENFRQRYLLVLSSWFFFSFSTKTIFSLTLATTT